MKVVKGILTAAVFTSLVSCTSLYGNAEDIDTCRQMAYKKDKLNVTAREDYKRCMAQKTKQRKAKHIQRHTDSLMDSLFDFIFGI
ncbi:hypothetical protein [Saccharobesus litoralis]|uniref:hypothetical protein n=1 Tax=Saccharobesus litoralis TaxID=2172099 RepID=UPI00131F0913|nr:hypothetical protein [Saccharobesus litoralis]